MRDEGNSGNENFQEVYLPNKYWGTNVYKHRPSLSNNNFPYQPSITLIVRLLLISQVSPILRNSVFHHIHSLKRKIFLVPYLAFSATGFFFSVPEEELGINARIKSSQDLNS